MMKRHICVARGDGIGPEVVEATLKVLTAMKAPLEYVFVDMGRQQYDKGLSTGMTTTAKALVEEHGVLLKGPMETPKGKGVKSINVTARKMWSAYANKRVFKTIPGIDTVFSKAGIPVDIIMVRENIEDTYGGIEHMLTNDVALCRRLITRSGSEKVHKYTFEMAKKQGRKRVTCGHKANIMKITDGLFLESFYDVAKQYPDIAANDIIVDDLAMKLASRPDKFDVLVLPNLQGDIMSDLCAGLVGGLGFAPSANIGDHVCVFEAVHGTAPDIAGKNMANPTALLMSTGMMLRSLGLHPMAKALDDALLSTFQSGIRMADFGDARKPALSTSEFAEAVIAHLPKDIPISAPKAPSHASAASHSVTMLSPANSQPRRLRGADYFVESQLQPQPLGDAIKAALPKGAQLTMISNRGTQVWPTGSVFTDCCNQYRVRVEWASENVQKSENEMRAMEPIYDQVYDFAKTLHRLNIRVCSIESLLEVDGKATFSLAQGQ